ncbi:MAG: hypothetical protein J7494_11345 [Sphingobium sp.]|nr:hypothetical protein [Sphingobium sp.]
MSPVTIEDRKKELRALLDKMRAEPSRDWTWERERIVVLQGMIAADQAHREHA